MAVRPRVPAGPVTSTRSWCGAALACALIAAVTTGCNRAPDGTVALSWTGADTGAALLEATARRCGRGTLHLFATAGDTGLGVVMDPAGGELAGNYPVVPAAVAGRGMRVAARWTDSLRVAGYLGASGSAVVTGRDSLISGALTAEAADSGTGRRVTLLAKFRGVPVTACDSADTGAP